MPGTQRLQGGEERQEKPAKKGLFRRLGKKKRKQAQVKSPGGMKKIKTPRAGDDEDHTVEHPKARPGGKPGEEYFPREELAGRYEYIRFLGKGSYGWVCEAKSLHVNEFVDKEDRCAIKKIDRVFNNDIDAKRLLRELRILRTLQSHESIVDMVDIIPPQDAAKFNKVVLVFEFVDTDLSKLFKSRQFFNTMHVKYMLYQVLLALKFMHSAHIAHRDLKPANILVNENCSLKICDFGLARGFNESQSAMQDPVVDAALAVQMAKDTLDKLQQQGDGVTSQPTSPAPDADGSGAAASADGEAAAPKKKPRKKARLKKDKGKKGKSAKEKEMTRHVVTRWYRPPEVILLEQKREYLMAVDMWSVGCIFGELLQMQAENCKNPYHRKPLFPGHSCFPLTLTDPFCYSERTDQLNMIFDVIGTPTDEEIDMLRDDKAKKYLRSLEIRRGQNLKTRFPGAPDDGLDLLMRFLTFDVTKRITSEAALNHSFVSRVRDKQAEKGHAPTKFEFEDVALSKRDLRELILGEIRAYNPGMDGGPPTLDEEDAKDAE